MAEKNYTVYRHRCPNGKVYVGVTKQNPKKRWKNGFGYQENKHFFNAIVKYGWDNIEHTIIVDGITEEQAYGVEKELIKHYKSNYDKYGYNKSIGGRYSNEGAIGKKRKSPNYKRKVPKGGKSYRAKRIVQFDVKGNKKKVWSCGVHAAEKLGLKASTCISNCCNFKQITAHGYI